MNYKKIGSLLNKENAYKAYSILKKYGCKALFNKIKLKLTNGIFHKFLSDNDMPYANFIFDDVVKKDTYHISEIDIVIPIYNAYDYTCTCIESVYKYSSIKYNLFLINDASPDERISAYLKELKQKEKPSFLNDLIIIEHDKNKGFVQTVNEAMGLSKNDVIILNTDTEVVPGWLERIIYPLENNDRIASVTPFSNCATICSFPNFCEDNELYLGKDLLEVDQAFKECGFKPLIDMPTGVGFCMLLSRACLDEVGLFDAETFAMGYGEENDWCMRARKAGYKNVIAADLYIYHKHGASFNSRSDKKKEERIAENLLKLNKKHPEYDVLVQDFVGQDILFAYREIIKWKLNHTKPGVLFINHNMGGGAKLYQDKLIKDIEDEYQAYDMIMISDYKSIRIENKLLKRELYFNIDMIDEKEFNRLLSLLDIERIFVNQLVTFPIDKIMDLIYASNLPYTYFVHDFYCICPRYTLTTDNDVYCNAENKEEACVECLKKKKDGWGKLTRNKRNIVYWRKRFLEFLQRADKVIAPSDDTSQIVRKYYPEVNIMVKEHELLVPMERTFKESFAREEILNIAVVGAIGNIKGSKIIYDLVDVIAEKKLPVNIKIIGYTNVDAKYKKSNNGILEITGPYKKEDISKKLAKYKAAIVFIPSIWPETYSYTTSEAMAAGYPILCFNVGAHAKRVERKDCGWIVGKIDLDDLVKTIVYIADNRDEIIEKAARLKNDQADS